MKIVIVTLTLCAMVLICHAQANDLQERVRQLRPAHATPLTIHNHAKIDEALTNFGHARVIVRLNAPNALAIDSGSETALEYPAERQPRRAVISELQRAVLSRVSFVHAGSAKRFDFIPYLALEVDRKDFEELVASPDIDGIEEDIPVPPSLLQSVPLLGGVNGAFSGYTGKGQTVAILDTGVDKSHPFLAGKVVAEACFSTTDSTATAVCESGSTAPDSGAPCDLSINGCRHGTHIAGIAAGNGTFSGVAKDASLIAVQIFSRLPASFCGTPSPCVMSFPSDQIAAMNHIYNLRETYHIASVNMSLGGGVSGSYCDSYMSATKAAIDALRDVNIATVIAAGNNGSAAGISSPACISSAISVSATTKSDSVANYANNAPILSLLAPGSAIYSSVPGGDYQTLDGTSLAAPHVSGAWAVLKSVKPTATVSEILNVLQTSGIPITDPRNRIIKPRIQLDAAVKLLSPNSAPVVSLTAPLNGATYTDPATVILAADATDSDGAVSEVQFLDGSTLLARVATAPYRFTWNNVPPGTHTLVAMATDNRGATATSAAIVVTVTRGERVNVALAANGGLATASSAASLPARAANDGDRKGLNSSGAIWLWRDTSFNTWPDWLQITFNREKTISEIDIFTAQDHMTEPVEPTAGMLFTRNGITAFDVQYWNGSAWSTIRSITGNNQIWRTVSFPPVTTDRIRVMVYASLANSSRITEIEAYEDNGSSLHPPNVTLTAPHGGDSFTAPAAITVTATVSVADGGIVKVEFFSGTNLIGTTTMEPYSITWNNVPSGTYALTARVTDNHGATATSSAATVTVREEARTNVALAANGGVATASSSGSLPPRAVNDGDRKGLNFSDAVWLWRDTSFNIWPDWVQITFNRERTISEIDIFTAQDNMTKPVEPTAGMLFTRNGITAFDVQYWNGSAWSTIQSITGNNQVWRTVSFPPITTDRIRVVVNASLGNNSRITEIEAY